MHDLVNDIYYAVRQLRRSPVFTVVALSTIALGIAANVVIFTAVNAFVLRPLPYQDPDRLVSVSQTLLRLGFSSLGTNYEDFADWKRRAHSFTALAAYRTEGFSIETPDGSERVTGTIVSTGIFETLGVQPMIGHSFLPEDGLAGRGNVVLISNELWTRSFARDPAIAGRTVTVNGAPAAIIGVMPAKFGFPETSELWMPLTPRHDRGNAYIQVLGRLSPGVARQSAETEMRSIVEQLNREYPKTNLAGTSAIIRPLRDNYGGDVRPALWILSGAVGLVLLIACANVAHLLLARSALRQREMAIRSALGACRKRIIRQLLTESLLLSTAGGGLAFVMMVVAEPLLLRRIPAFENLPAWMNPGWDWRVAGFTIAVSLLSGTAFGIAPALRYSRSNRTAGWIQGARHSGGRHERWIHSSLIALEVATALVLSIGAGLLIQSFLRLERIDPGFDPHNVISAQVLLNATPYAKPDQRRLFYSKALDRFAAIPGVDQAAAVSELPLNGRQDSTGYLLEGEPVDPANFKLAQVDVVTPNYFTAMRIPIIRGRAFNTFDSAESAPVVIIDQSFAEKRWPGQDPIGKRIRFSTSPNAPYTTVIGVAANVRIGELKIQGREDAYFSYLQYPVSNTFNFLLRVQDDPLGISKAARTELQRMDPEQPFFDVRPLEDVVGQSIRIDRVLSETFDVFTGIAVFLGLVGIYGVVAYVVEQRRNEIGIRMALGAHPRDLVRSVLFENLRLIAAGIAVGLVVSLSFNRILKGILVNVSPTDHVTFIAVSILITAVSLSACLIPARRITRVAPAECLRSE